MIESATVMVDYLLHKGRTDFVSLLYTVTEVNVQRRETLALALDAAGMTWASYSFFFDDGVPQPQNEDFGQLRTAIAALKRVKDSGYRTIVVFLEDSLKEFPALADAAEELGMNNGDYFWVWFGLFEPVFIYSDNANITKLIAGSPLLLPLSDGGERFTAAWKSQGSDFVDRVKAFNPIPEGAEGYVNMADDYFEKTRPEFGSDFLFDAVMSIGIGACLAEKQTDNSVNGSAHLLGIRSVQFFGATGDVKFYQVGARAGGRVKSTTFWGAYNLLPPQPPGGNFVPFAWTDVLGTGSSSTWEEIAPFTFADGRMVPPDLLRDQPKQNYLSSGLLAFGLALMLTVFVAAIATIVWVYICRKHRVLLAAQPEFLYVLAFASIVLASTILPLSFDESQGWSTKSLNRACVASTWLLTMGVIMTYGALFTKLWRVHKVLQFKKRRIKIRQAAWPMLVLAVCAVIVLSVWTAVDGLEWTREILDDDTGESMGKCDGDHAGVYVGLLAVLMLIPAVLTGFMAYKTKDVSAQYSDARWIWVLFLVQLEGFFVAVPTVVVLRNVSTNGRYLGLSFILWIFPVSTLSLIMVPKVLAYRAAIRGPTEEIVSHQRGEACGVHVSGISDEHSSNTSSFKYNEANLSSSFKHNGADLLGEHEGSEKAHLSAVAED